MDYVIPANDDAIRAVKLIAAEWRTLLSKQTRAKALTKALLLKKHLQKNKEANCRGVVKRQTKIKSQEENKMAVTAQMVKELREMTGAGMMDCKKALVEVDGNIGCC